MSSYHECACARVCPNCKAAEPVGEGELLWPAGWRCRKCGEPVPVIDGIPHYAPALADRLAGYDPEFFSMLAPCEPGHFWFEPRNRLLLGLADRYFPSARRYLEIGCGTGFVLGALARSRPWSRLVGTEIHPAGLGTARQRLGEWGELVQMDARAIPARAAFDLVGAFDVLEHIVEYEAVIGEVSTALVPGGGFIVAVPQHPALWSEWDEAAYHVRRYRRGELEGKLRAARFEILFSTSYTVALLPLLAMSRLKCSSPFRREPQEPRIARGLNPSPLLNATLRSILRAEVALALRGVPWPVGGSRIVVARKRSSG